MDNQEFNQFLYGAVMMASIAAGIFFLKFWRKTTDRFFLLFSLAFFLLAIERFIFVFIQSENEVHTYVFVFRLLAFMMITGAVVEKNRA
ncbi:hypothetical protein AZI87_04335 [Bdellovibrio bacteriovorus]|uniref:Uncharacterized protein n=1 Tax=Bdellovibrio bacteriovorus TaxID=959 RepID=A0A162GM49_BDEBC|nr:DUF5985 family protein [Bdellovibrio bacteriovorus]KYG68481.1 hypothetical protein AZI87_04335 [Bdellovibrio bacteriovorus]